MENVREIMKTAFFASLTVFLIKLGAEAFKTPDTLVKIVGGILIFLGLCSAGVVLYLLGLYDFN